MSIDEVMNRIIFPIYRTEDIRNLIEWMKEYNRSHSDKLSFYGFDLQNPDTDLNLILDFVKENSIEKGAGLADSFDSYLNGSTSFRDASLSDGFESLNSLKIELETNRDAYQDLYNYDRILDCIENVMRARELTAKYDGDNGMVEGGQYRDQMMAKSQGITATSDMQETIRERWVHSSGMSWVIPIMPSVQTISLQTAICLPATAEEPITGLFQEIFLLIRRESWERIIWISPK